MCRFLLAKSKETINVAKVLGNFADMCGQSRAPDGDRQEDGWGMAWIDRNENWQNIKSLNPIWKDRSGFSRLPKTRMLVVHARSASFADQKGEIEYNQPFVNENKAFVFNGMLRGVKLPFRLEGKIGAQKIWSLLQKKSLENAQKLLHKHSNFIRGLNIGLASKNNISALCDYGEDDEYFTLRYASENGVSIICSEEIVGFDFAKMKKGEIKVY